MDNNNIIDNIYCGMNEKQLKERALHIAAYFGYDVNSLSLHSINVQDAYCRGIKHASIEYESLVKANKELLENLIRLVDRLEENDFGHMSAVIRAKEAIKKHSPIN